MREQNPGKLDAVRHLEMFSLGGRNADQAEATKTAASMNYGN